MSCLFILQQKGKLHLQVFKWNVPSHSNQGILSAIPTNHLMVLTQVTLLHTFLRRELQSWWWFYSCSFQLTPHHLQGFLLCHSLWCVPAETVPVYTEDHQKGLAKVTRNKTFSTNTKLPYYMFIKHLWNCQFQIQDYMSYKLWSLSLAKIHLALLQQGELPKHFQLFHHFTYLINNCKKNLFLSILVVWFCPGLMCFVFICIGGSLVRSSLYTINWSHLVK